MVTLRDAFCRIAPGQMELGLGIHGEPGASKAALQPVDEIVSQVPLALEKIPLPYAPWRHQHAIRIFH